jgi:hypothetical protein
MFPLILYRYFINYRYNFIQFIPEVFLNFYIFAISKLLRGVIGNTSDSGSEKFRFEP